MTSAGRQSRSHTELEAFLNLLQLETLGTSGAKFVPER